LEKPPEELSVSHLSHLMAEAARAFADLKFTLDTQARYSHGCIPDDLHGPMSYGEYGPHSATDFFSAIMPFLPRDLSSRKGKICKVPVANTLGCSWRWWPGSDMSAEEEERIRLYISSKHDINDTAYMWIPELGICLPSEGKNRVNFCRYHRIETITACIYVNHYPEPDRIKIYDLKIAGGRETWAVLDEQYVQKISHFVYALPLLRAYGVKIESEWPVTSPPLYKILKFAKDCSITSKFHREVIDLVAIREKLDDAARKLAQGEEWVRGSILDLPVYRKYVYFSALSVVLTVFSVFVIIFRQSDYSGVFVSIFMILFSVIMFFMVPIFKFRRKNLAGKSCQSDREGLF
jgi:hypothetical protein